MRIITLIGNLKVTVVAAPTRLHVAAPASPVAPAATLLSPSSVSGADLLAISPVTSPASRHPSIFDAASCLGAPNMFSDGGGGAASREHSPQPQPQQPQQQPACPKRMLAEEVAQVGACFTPIAGGRAKLPDRSHGFVPTSRLIAQQASFRVDFV